MGDIFGLDRLIQFNYTSMDEFLKKSQRKSLV